MLNQKQLGGFNGMWGLRTGLLAMLGLCACSEPDPWQFGADCAATIEPGSDDQTTVQTALIDAEEDSVVCVGPGTFTFKTERMIWVVYRISSLQMMPAPWITSPRVSSSVGGKIRGREREKEKGKEVELRGHNWWWRRRRGKNFSTRSRLAPVPRKKVTTT